MKKPMKMRITKMMMKNVMKKKKRMKKPLKKKNISILIIIAMPTQTPTITQPDNLGLWHSQILWEGTFSRKLLKG